MKKYKAIIFDYGGVIKGLPGPIWSEKVADLLGVSNDEFREIYYRHNHRFNIGNESFSDVLLEIAKELGKENNFKRVLDFISEPEQLNRNIIELIQHQTQHYLQASQYQHQKATQLPNPSHLSYENKTEDDNPIENQYDDHLPLSSKYKPSP